MPDDLRSRIAAALYNADVELWDWLEEMKCSTTRFNLADAVIRELNLHEENGWFGPTNIPKHRYVTDWIPDE